MLFNSRASLFAALATTICFMHSPAYAAEQVKRVNIFVHPYYESAKGAAIAPKTVNVSKDHDVLLASTKQADIVKARDDIAQKNELITPITLAVLAIRLYDVGLRDDAVFWFYVAKDRYATLAAVADMKASNLVQIADSFSNFADLAGITINGYAFCDLARQRKQREKAFNWVKDNPYQALFLPQIPALAGDRKQNLASGLSTIEAKMAKELAFTADPKNVVTIKQARAKSEMEAKFCWK
jgi:hypothetical protein